MALLVGTVVVSYNSDVDALRRNLVRIASLSHVVICDNSTDPAISYRIAEFSSSEKMSYLRMDGNRGIAYAQNRGIELLKTLGVTYILFLDDDSTPFANMLEKLVEGYNDLVESDVRVGAVGAVAISATGTHVSNSKLSLSNFTRCSLMMSSGSMIPLSTIEEIGMMDESLFIGFVDFDWGWRAQFHGYELYLVNDAYFQHSLGHGIKHVLGFELKIPSPVRHYYQFRNAICLISRPHVPCAWIAMQIPGLAVRFVLYSFFLAPRWKRVVYMLRGLIDGVGGNMGAINAKV